MLEMKKLRLRNVNLPKVTVEVDSAQVCRLPRLFFTVTSSARTLDLSAGYGPSLQNPLSWQLLVKAGPDPESGFNYSFLPLSRSR